MLGVVQHEQHLAGMCGGLPLSQRFLNLGLRAAVGHQRQADVSRKAGPQGFDGGKIRQRQPLQAAAPAARISARKFTHQATLADAARAEHGHQPARIRRLAQHRAQLREFDLAPYEDVAYRHGQRRPAARRFKRLEGGLELGRDRHPELQEKAGTKRVEELQRFSPPAGLMQAVQQLHGGDLVRWIGGQHRACDFDGAQRGCSRGIDVRQHRHTPARVQLAALALHPFGQGLAARKAHALQQWLAVGRQRRCVPRCQRGAQDTDVTGQHQPHAPAFRLQAIGNTPA